MSDTPKTDAMLHYEPTKDRDERGNTVILECVSPHFARQLERANTELLEALKALVEYVTEMGCPDDPALHLAYTAIANAEGK